MSEPYSVIVYWRDGRMEVVARSHNPCVLAEAPTVARNPAAIRRIEMHDLTGCLETVWDASWHGVGQ